MKIYIVIPAYLASGTLPRVLERIPADVYREINKIIIVDDGWSIEPSVNSAIMSRFEKIHLINHHVRLGYAGAQKTAYDFALNDGADITVLLHADGQYAPEIMKSLYDEILKDRADVVLGSRMKKIMGAFRGGMPVYKIIANYVLSRLENLCYGMDISEYHSGYMVYSRKALENIPYKKLSGTFHFDGEMLMMAGKLKLRIADIPIPTHYGNEKSHLKPVIYGLNVLKIMWRYKTGKYNFDSEESGGPF